MSDHNQKQAQVDRPGCITIYAILLWVGAALYLIGLTCLGFSFLSPNFADQEYYLLGMIIACFSLFLVGFTVAAGLGIWRMKKWGWWLVVIYNSLSLASSLLSSVVGLVVGELRSVLLALIGMLVPGLILYWFITNRYFFEEGAAAATVIGPDGEPVRKPSSTSTTVATAAAIAGAAIVILCLVSVVVIAILAILGPQKGNVFSQITDSLQETP